MTEQPVSAYAASRLLGRDRQTIERAVRHLAPDGFRNGRPHWRLDRIADAVAMTPQERRDAAKCRDKFSVGRNRALDGLRLAIEKQIVAISAEPSPDRKREMALALAPDVAEHHALFLRVGRELGVTNDDVLGIQSDLIWTEWLAEIGDAAKWSEGFSLAMIKAAWPDTDDDGEAE